MAPNPSAHATRQKLLDAATAELIREQGHLQMRSVAEAAGVAISLINHHFGSRSGLVASVVDAYYDRLHDEALDLDLRHHGSWLAGEQARMSLVIAFLVKEPLTPIIYGSMTRDAEIAATETHRIARVAESSSRSIAWAQRQGEVPASVDPTVAGAAIFGAIRQVALVLAKRGEGVDIEVVTTHLWRVSRAALGLATEHLG